MTTQIRPRHLALFGALALLGSAQGATVAQLVLQPEITLSDGGNGHKPKIQRASDGTLVAVYGDSPAGAGNIYDTKGAAERGARDVFVKFCKPDRDSAPAPRKTCDLPAHWAFANTPAGGGNVSAAALKSSIATAWKANGAGGLIAYPGNTDKPNIKTSGRVMVLTWVSAYCPNGDLRSADADGDTNLNQRAIRYIEREGRTIPFHCTWAAYSNNNGLTWQAPIQISNGERDAKQDSSGGTFDNTNNLARIVVSWQEDPEGLQLGEADGPGDGASGANTTGGTDIWYAHFNVLADSSNTLALSPLSAGTARAIGYRVSDNWELEQKYGLAGQITNVFDAAGVPVDGKDVEQGTAGASRANIGMVGTRTVLAWEETKGAEGLDVGKFIRYQTFAYNAPPAVLADKAGCVISNPARNARRVRFLTQSAAEATGVAAPAVPGKSGINIAVFWKEGLADKGGPSDIILRRGMVDPAVTASTQSGLPAGRMLPAVDAGCATSVYAGAIALNNTSAENISSRSPDLGALVNGLGDDTELNNVENALAHRGVLRGNELWVGYNYTNDLVKMWAQIDNYNFWVRKFSYDAATGGSWGLPQNVTNVTDRRINVREPRLFGTPPSNTGATFCDGSATQDTSFCQNRDVIYLMWGTQENVSPFDPDGGNDLGVFATVSLDAGKNYAAPARFSVEMGSLFNDDESAFETQPATRPDGTRVYGVFNTANATTGTSAAAYRSGDVTTAIVPDPVTPPVVAPLAADGGGGCTAALGRLPVDPMLPALALLALLGLGLRRWRLARIRAGQPSMQAIRDKARN